MVQIICIYWSKQRRSIFKKVIVISILQRSWADFSSNPFWNNVVFLNLVSKHIKQKLSEEEPE